jgi:hypothetical protein
VRLASHLNRFARGSELGVTLAAAEDLPEPFVDQAITLAACGQANSKPRSSDSMLVMVW